MTYDGAGNDQICHILEFWMKEGMKAERAAVESGFNKWVSNIDSWCNIFINVS